MYPYSITPNTLHFIAYFCRINTIPSILDNPIEYLKGVGPLKADLLKKELSIFTFGDLLEHFPLRHVDKTRINAIRPILLPKQTFAGEEHWQKALKTKHPTV